MRYLSTGVDDFTNELPSEIIFEICQYLTKLGTCES